MKKPHSLLVAVLPAVLLATAHVASAAPPASAAPASSAVPQAAVQTPTLEVVVSGLNHPRGLWVGPFGIVLVAESGREGNTPCLPPSPGTANKPVCVSTTGAVTLAWAGAKFQLVENLASLGATDGTAASGPHDISVTEQGLQVLYGYANNPNGRAGLGPAAAPLGTLSLIDFHGDQSIVGDLAAHELNNNPGGEPGFAGLWSNPFSILRNGANTLVVDSGGNTILNVTPSGQVSTVAVLPSRLVPAPPPLPPMIPMESVPTGMVRGPDGAIYVGELTGFPFPVGGARVFKIVPGQAPQVVATGFTNVIDIGFDSQGRLLVLEHATNGLLSGNPTGAVKRVESNGSTTTLVSTGLISPTAMVVAPNGSVYVSNNATNVGGGEVVRFVPPA